MRSKFYLAAAGLCLLCTPPAFAIDFNLQSINALQNVYLENKGQIADQNGHPRPDVKFIYNGDGFKMYLREDGFSYEWFTASPGPGSMSEAGEPRSVSSDDEDENDVPYQYLSNRVDIYFQRANNKAAIVTGQPQPFYINYYTNNTGPLRNFPNQQLCGNNLCKSISRN